MIPIFDMEMNSIPYKLNLALFSMFAIKLNYLVLRTQALGIAQKKTNKEKEQELDDILRCPGRPDTCA